MVDFLQKQIKERPFVRFFDCPSILGAFNICKKDNKLFYVEWFFPHKDEEWEWYQAWELTPKEIKEVLKVIT